MTDSMFNADDFLNEEVQEGFSTAHIPVPEGTYSGYIGEVSVRTWVKRDDPSVSGKTLKIVWELDDHDLKALLEKDSVQVQQSIKLDVVEDGNGKVVLNTARGANVGLGRLRTALNCNTGRFSLNSLVGMAGNVVVAHRTGDPDQLTGEPRIYAEVAVVTPL